MACQAGKFVPREDPALDFDMPVDLCGVDYPDREPRMEVVLHLYSLSKRHRIRVNTAWATKTWTAPSSTAS